MDFLVTEDLGIHRKAVRLGLDDHVLTVADALDIVRGLYETVPTTPPAVEPITADRLDPSDPDLRRSAERLPGLRSLVGEGHEGEAHMLGNPGDLEPCGDLHRE